MEAEVKAEIGRIDAENNRQNHRLDAIEEDLKSIQSLAMSVQKLAINMEQMLNEQVKQGNRLDALETNPSKEWTATKRAFFNSLLGAIGSAIGMAILYAIIQNVR